MKPFFKTKKGRLYVGHVEDVLATNVGKNLTGKVQLLLTSPPFPLNHKKAYGNRNGEEYVKWLSDFAPIFAKLLKPDGSIVIEIGNAWEPKRPVQSLMSLKALLEFAEHPKAQLRLCQEFVCYNRARLPSPAEWVTIRRIRVKDSYTHVWWLATDDKPKSNNRNVAKEYSASMKRLLQRQQYNAGSRPSGYVIGETSFFTDNGGAIPSNLIEFSNTQSSDLYLRACKERGAKPHPARMPKAIPEFFIKLLTDEGDLVFDPFGGSNVTGSVAESLGRRWVTIEAQEDYALQSTWRFEEASKKRSTPAAKLQKS